MTIVKIQIRTPGNSFFLKFSPSIALHIRVEPEKKRKAPMSAVCEEISAVIVQGFFNAQCVWPFLPPAYLLFSVRIPT